MSNRVRMLLGIAVLIVMAGCQPKPGTVAGVVTLDGKPISLTSDSRGTVVFQPTGGKGTMATGLLDPAGRFELGTGAMHEVAPGKYQVAISIVELLPATDHAEQAGKRVTPAKYASAIDSGLQAEVVPGLNEFKFDLDSAEADATPSPPAAAAPPSAAELNSAPTAKAEGTAAPPVEVTQ
jgi:hypothetical protein